MKKTLMGASAVALGAIGLLVSTSAADAAPKCKQWGFDGATTIVEPGTGWQVDFFSQGSEASGLATASNNHGESKTGEISGGLNGGRFNVRIDYGNGQTQGYRGGVYGSDGIASGVTANNIPNESGKPFTVLVTCLQPS